MKVAAISERKWPARLLALAALFIFLGAFCFPTESRSDACPIEGCIKDPETQTGDFNGAKDVSDTGASTANTKGDDSISQGDKNLDKGKKNDNSKQMALGAMQVLQGLLSKMAAMKLAQNASQAGARSNNLSSVTQSPATNGAAGSTTYDSSISAPSSTSPSSSTSGRSQGLSVADLRQGTLGRAVGQIQSNYGITPNQLLNALQSGATPQAILANAPQNAPSPGTLNQISRGLAMYSSTGTGSPVLNPAASGLPPSLNAGTSDASSGSSAASSQDSYINVKRDGSNSVNKVSDDSPEDQTALKSTTVGTGRVSPDGTFKYETISKGTTTQGPIGITDMHGLDGGIQNHYLGLEGELDNRADLSSPSENKATFSNQGLDPRLDLVKTKDLIQGPGAPIVPLGKVPAVGDQIKLFGHPMADYGGLKVKMEGNIKGIFQNPDGTFDYLCDCPTNNAFVGGMSGGMVTNEAGQVIGVVRSHSILDTYNGSAVEQPYFSRLVHITPVGQDSQGNFLGGQWNSFHTDDCYNEFDIGLGPHSCDVNMFGNIARNGDSPDSPSPIAENNPSDQGTDPRQTFSATSVTELDNGTASNVKTALPSPSNADNGENSDSSQLALKIRFSFVPSIFNSPRAKLVLENYLMKRCLPRNQVIVEAQAGGKPVASARSIVIGERSWGMDRFSLICQGWTKEYANRHCENQTKSCFRKFAPDVSLLNSSELAQKSIAEPTQQEPLSLLESTYVKFWQVSESFRQFSFSSRSSAQRSYYSLTCFSKGKPDPSSCSVIPLDAESAGMADEVFASSFNLDGRPNAAISSASRESADSPLDADQRATVGAAFCAIGAEVNLTDPQAAAPYYSECRRDLEEARASGKDGISLAEAKGSDPVAQKAFTDFEKDFGISKDEFLRVMFGPGGGPDVLAKLVHGKISAAMFAEALNVALKDLPSEGPRDKVQFFEAFGKSPGSNDNNQQRLNSLWSFKNDSDPSRSTASMSEEDDSGQKLAPSIFELASSKYAQIRVQWENRINPLGLRATTY